MAEATAPKATIVLMSLLSYGFKTGAASPELLLHARIITDVATRLPIEIAARRLPNAPPKRQHS